MNKNLNNLKKTLTSIDQFGYGYELAFNKKKG